MPTHPSTKFSVHSGPTEFVQPQLGLHKPMIAEGYRQKVKGWQDLVCNRYNTSFGDQQRSVLPLYRQHAKQAETEAMGHANKMWTHSSCCAAGSQQHLHVDVPH